MESSCTTCGKDCVFKRRPNAKIGELFGIACDYCKLFFCKGCINLTAAEIDALTIQNRCISFYCTGCKGAFPDADLSQQYESLKTQLNQKINYIHTLEEDMEDLKTSLGFELDRLVKDNKMKDDHIKRLQRRTETLDDEVFLAEKAHETTIQSLRDELLHVKKEFVVLQNKNADLSELNKGLVAKLQSLEEVLDDLKSSKNSLLNNISSLTIENEEHLQNIINLNNQLCSGSSVAVSVDKCFQTDLMSTDSTDEACNSMAVPSLELGKIVKDSATSGPILNLSHIGNNGSYSNSMVKHKKRLLLLCDQMGRGLDNNLRKKLDDTYVIQSIIKPFASFESIWGNVETLARDYGVDDYLILFAGYNNFSDNLFPKFQFIVNKLKILVHTNVIILSTPICFKNPSVCYSFNYRLKNLVYKLEKFSSNKMHFVNSCNVLGKKHSNFELSELISSVTRFSSNKNLLYIKLNDIISDGPPQSILNSTHLSALNLNSSSCDDSQSINNDIGLDLSLSVCNDVLSISPGTTNTSGVNFQQELAEITAT